MSIRVIKQGILDTIQDAGRYGYQHLGINPCGAMDTVAASVANLLACNNINEAVLELHFPASSFFFEEDATIALSGADFHAAINNIRIPINKPFIVSKGALLQFTKYAEGARCYLAIHGGWQADHWLNSYSTHLKAQCGGYHGRALKKNDVLMIKEGRVQLSLPAQNTLIELPVSIDRSLFYSGDKILCVKGNEYDRLNSEDKQLFSSSSFRISLQSDRMGYHLDGSSLISVTNSRLLSSAVTKGTVQLLPSGQLIVLMADHQTTGGYPKIAHVTSASLPMLAQTRPNEYVQFKLIEHGEAEILYIQQQQNLQLLRDTINLQLQQFFSSHDEY